MEYRRYDINITGRYFCYLFAALIIAVNIACGTGTVKYDQEAWDNAFKKQEIIDTKPELVSEIEEIYKSPGLADIDDQNVYIIGFNDLTINIYSKKNFRLKKRIGGRGEGPSEFRWIQGIKIYENFIFVNSPGKNSYFSKKGELLKEVKCPPSLIPCLPVGDNFITNEYSMPSEDDITSSYRDKIIVLVGPDFKREKSFFKKD